MISWLLLLLIACIIVLIPTAYAGYIGAPYVPVRRRALRKAFDALKVGPGDVVVDLGAGDGGVLTETTRRGAKAIGYELSPIMWIIAQARLFFARGKNPPLTPPLSRRGTKNASPDKGRWPKAGGVYLRNFYQQQLPQDTTIVFVFLMPRNLPRLLHYLQQQNLPKARYLLSYTFALPDLHPATIIQTPTHGTVYVYNWQQLR